MSSTTAEVNGTDFDAIKSDVSYNGDELPVPEPVLIPSPENGGSAPVTNGASPNALIVAISDKQQSAEDKSALVMSNTGRSKLEMIMESGIRRSPRLPPQVEGARMTDGSKLKRMAPAASSDKKQNKRKRVLVFVGEPVPEQEAQERWGWRYKLKGERRNGQSGILNAGEDDEVHVNVACHYLQANVNGCIFSLGDCAHIKGEGNQPHVGRIVEFFKTSDDENYFRVQWFFRAEDTVIKKAAAFHDKKRLFFSTLMNDNLLECILSKVTVVEKAPMLGFRSTSIQPSDYYCDMEYSVKYSTFRSLVTGKKKNHFVPVSLASRFQEMYYINFIEDNRKPFVEYWVNMSNVLSYNFPFFQKMIASVFYNISFTVI